MMAVYVWNLLVIKYFVVTFVKAGTSIVKEYLYTFVNDVELPKFAVAEVLK